MKSAAVLSTSILAFLLAITVLAGAKNDRSRDHEGGDHHGREGNVHHDSAHQSQPQHGNHHANGPEHGHQQPREFHDAVQRGPEHQAYREHAPAHLHEVSRTGPVRQDIWQRQRAHNWQREHRPWHARGGYHGYFIPEDRFRAHFGRGHWFRVHEVPVVVVEGSPRFQFGGYWFSVVDPCPETWSPVWYRTDDVYVDYVNDGYYMYNRRHPGIAIAINVSL
ncbi:MAG: hypothetical protein LAO18_17695 [Acidobacteriia bacterium]|nr:hypothetical protein [Terriglobia bacterium]